MEPDGTGKRLVCHAENGLHDVGMFTVGGGCLYVKNGNKLMGVNMENGNRKYFPLKKGTNQIYYGGGFLYMYGYGTGISRMNVLTGETELVAGNVADAHLEAGYLCIVQEEILPGEVEYCLNVIDLKTGECVSERFWKTGEKSGIAYLGVTDDWIIVWGYEDRDARFYFRYGNGMLLEEKNGGDGT